MRILIGIVTFALLSASAETEVPPEIQVAAFAYALEKDSQGFMRCLEVNESNPPDEVLSKVTQKSTDIVRGSECEEVMDVNKGSFHRATGRKALFVKLAKYQRIDNTHAKIGLITYHHGKWAEGSALFLESTKHGWIVSRQKHAWVA